MSLGWGSVKSREEKKERRRGRKRRQTAEVINSHRQRSVRGHGRTHCGGSKWNRDDTETTRRNSVISAKVGKRNRRYVAVNRPRGGAKGRKGKEYTDATGTVTSLLH